MSEYIAKVSLDMFVLFDRVVITDTTCHLRQIAACIKALASGHNVMAYW